MQTQARFHQTIEDGFSVVEDFAVALDFFAGFLGKGFDVQITLLQRIHNIFQLQLIISTLFALKLTVLAASLVTRVIHGESSKRWERQALAQLRMQCLGNLGFSLVARGLAPEHVLQSTVGNHRGLSFREACLAQEQLKFWK
ncbi:hypothetical protein D3C76_1350780 [compost metagenome]